MYGTAQRSIRWWRRPAVIAGVAVIVLLVVGPVGVVIGRGTAEHSTSEKRHDDSALPAVSTQTLHAPHGPTRMRGELPVGFTDDKAGALSCAAVAAEALVDYVQVRRSTAAQAWLATYAAADLSSVSMQKILDWNPGLYLLKPSDRPTTLAPRRGAVGVTEMVPVGYKILSFSPTKAHVQVWLHGVGWSQGSAFPNLVIDHSADIELVWMSGDWKITSYTQPADQPWPGPALDDASGSSFAPWPGGQFTFLTG